ncbi:hypothetical protein P3L10_012699 [Capsicum annuum]
MPDISLRPRRRIRHLLLLCNDLNRLFYGLGRDGENLHRELWWIVHFLWAIVEQLNMEPEEMITTPPSL